MPQPMNYAFPRFETVLRGTARPVPVLRFAARLRQGVEPLAMSGMQALAAFLAAFVIFGLAKGVMDWAIIGFKPGNAHFAMAFEAALGALMLQAHLLSTTLATLAHLPPVAWPAAIPLSAAFVGCAPVLAVLLPRHLRLVGWASIWLSLMVMGIYLQQMGGL